MHSYVARVILTLALGTLLSAPLLAGEVTGKVASLIARSSDGLHYVVLDGAIANQPPCATKSYFMVKDETSDTGKSQFAMLLSAYMANRTVTIFGTGGCSRWSDGEDIDGIILRP